VTDLAARSLAPLAAESPAEAAAQAAPERGPPRQNSPRHDEEDRQSQALVRRVDVELEFHWNGVVEIEGNGADVGKEAHVLADVAFDGLKCALPGAASAVALGARGHQRPRQPRTVDENADHGLVTMCILLEPGVEVLATQ